MKEVKVISGFQKAVAGKPVFPCVKLICGNRVVSLVDHGTGFANAGEMLHVSHMDHRFMKCYEYDGIVDPDDMANTAHWLWNEGSDEHYAVKDPPRTLSAALLWLME